MKKLEDWKEKEKKKIKLLNKKYKKDIIKELKPFWEKREELASKWRKEERKLEEEMNKKLKLDIKLIFFYNQDGECCGIGADEWKDRKKFPLVDFWLGGE